MIAESDQRAEAVANDSRLGSKAPAFVQRHGTLHGAWRVMIFVFGLAVIGGGVILLPLPGPGWLIIFGGMAIWGTEFVWAQKVLLWTKTKVTEYAKRAADPRVRRRNLLITSAVVVVLAGLAIWYVTSYGFTLPWDIS
ncbi:TIGR02611 family protein [Actinacidiphila epipremni]|uniref:TIGR02611 family protein n=1 Tax=Actinacidiphila epipremni TaxID=2053013 RepID=A0ABX0ZMK5_9ACTN|nr:TIGR02611 family protein [Actinacidiphila epipremni]NJP44047.1 TIGR02611 family protein [Actinacidiphila epipremni]